MGARQKHPEAGVLFFYCPLIVKKRTETSKVYHERGISVDSIGVFSPNQFGGYTQRDSLAYYFAALRSEHEAR